MEEASNSDIIVGGTIEDDWESGLVRYCGGVGDRVPGKVAETDGGE
jgi:hypothetical protein